MGKFLWCFNKIKSFVKMNPQRFLVKIDLKLHAITCPGVWLCSHGYLEITTKTLGYFFRTGAIEPYFPLLCHDVYKMEGYFRNAYSIATLINKLQTEALEITLWQSGRRLSFYSGVLMDLLNVTEPKLNCPHADNKQLLMKPTTAFPGIIAPKVELSAEFYVKDQVFNLTNINDELKTSMKDVPGRTLGFLANTKTKLKSNDIYPNYQRPCIINPYQYDDSCSLNGPRKQRPVCHARDFPFTNYKPVQPPSYKPQSRRVSLVSTCSSNNTQISRDLHDLDLARGIDLVALHHPDGECCDLCRLYKEVFQN